MGKEWTRKRKWVKDMPVEAEYRNGMLSSVTIYQRYGESFALDGSDIEAIRDYLTDVLEG